MAAPIEMPSSEALAAQFMEWLAVIDKAETGDPEAIAFCLDALRSTIMASSTMLDDPGLRSAVEREITRQMKES